MLPPPNTQMEPTRRWRATARGSFATLCVMTTSGVTRPLTDRERRLARWMLENGSDEARQFLGQLEEAEATSWRCQCGCASFNFRVRGKPEAPPGVHVLGDYVFGTEADMAGAFVFSSDGILSGEEVYGLAGDAPAVLPEPETLRRFGATANEPETRKLDRKHDA